MCILRCCLFIAEQRRFKRRLSPVTRLQASCNDNGGGAGQRTYIRQREYLVTEDITAGELLLDLACVGAEIVLEVLPQYLEGKLKPVSKMTLKQLMPGRLDRETGKIDWSKSAREVHNLVRGTQPWYGAYTYYEGKRLKIMVLCCGRDDSTRVSDRQGRSSGAARISPLPVAPIINLEVIQPAEAELCPVVTVLIIILKGLSLANSVPHA